MDFKDKNKPGKRINSKRISCPIPRESLPPIPRSIFINSKENEILICPSLEEIYENIFSSNLKTE